MTAGPTRPDFETSAVFQRALALKPAKPVCDALFKDPDGAMHDRVFADDPFRNCAGAWAVGMQPVHFDVMTAARSTAVVARLTTTQKRIAS